MRPAFGTRPIQPGAVIGLLGGGQLGRMTALAARSMGYRIAVLDPDPECPARPVADLYVPGGFDDPAAIGRLAAQSDVLTYEIERISTDALRSALGGTPLRPGVEVLEVIQDRLRQKSWLAAHGFPVGPFLPAANAADLERAIAALGSCRVKRTRDGYDGRGQLRVPTGAEAALAFAQLGGPCIAEQELRLDLELSVLVARSPSGAMAVHPLAANQHEDGVLTCTLIPAPVSRRLAKEAVDRRGPKQWRGSDTWKVAPMAGGFSCLCGKPKGPPMWPWGGSSLRGLKAIDPCL